MKHCSLGLHTPLPFTFSSHFIHPFPKTDPISPGEKPAQEGGITPLSLPHTASMESPAHLSPLHKHLSPAYSLHAVESVNGICQVSRQGQEGPGSRHLPHCSPLRSGRAAPAKGYSQSQVLVDGKEQFRYHSAKRSVS